MRETRLKTLTVIGEHMSDLGFFQYIGKVTKNSLDRQWPIYVFCFILFNMCFILINYYYNGLPGNEIKVDFYTLQYFFTYKVEFMKRGFLGTVLNVLNITPTLRFVFYMSWIFSGLIFVLGSSILKKTLNALSKKQFFLFLLLFTVSPATAWNMGYEAGRADILNLLIQLALIALIINSGSRKMVYVPPLLVIGILNHEAFILMNMPIVFAILLCEVKARSVSRDILIVSALSGLTATMFVVIYGGIEPGSLTKLYKLAYQVPIPEDLPFVNPFMIVTSDLIDNIYFTLGETMKYRFVQRLLLAIPLLYSCFTMYFRIIDRKLISSVEKIVYLSPFAVVPMFVLGVDTYRWLAIMLINMTFSFAYLLYINPRSINLNCLESFRPYIKVVLFYSLLGPIGSRNNFPYVRKLNKIFLRPILNSII